jgi:hypothetical protein
MMMMVLRGIFGTKNEEITVWEKIRNEEVCNVYCSRDISRVM